MPKWLKTLSTENSIILTWNNLYMYLPFVKIELAILRTLLFLEHTAMFFFIILYMALISHGFSIFQNGFKRFQNLFNRTCDKTSLTFTKVKLAKSLKLLFRDFQIF